MEQHHAKVLEEFQNQCDDLLREEIVRSEKLLWDLEEQDYDPAELIPQGSIERKKRKVKHVWVNH